MPGPETKLKNKILKFLRSHEGEWDKINDRFTSGIPDILGCFRGVYVGIELKRKGEKARVLQAQVLKRIRREGGFGICIDTWEDFMAFYKILDKIHVRICTTSTFQNGRYYA